MQDWIISPHRRKKELLAWILCLFISEGLNVIGIIRYDTSWRELYSQLHIVFFLSIVLYLLFFVMRIIIQGVLRAFRR